MPVSDAVNAHLERLVDWSLRHSPLQLFYAWRSGRDLAVLAYHGITDEQCFADQMDHVCRAMCPVSLDRVLAALGGGQELPRRSVLVTFDDGDRSVLEKAIPILTERSIPAVAFVVAGLLDTDTPYWWEEAVELLGQGGTSNGHPVGSAGELIAWLKQVSDEQRLTVLEDLRKSAAGAARRVKQLRREELKMLRSAGIAIGNHSLTHPCLDRCSDDKLRAEVREAHRILVETLGTHPRVLAFPDGAFDARVTRELTALGYEAAFLFDHSLAVFPPIDRFKVSRVRTGSDTNLNRFGIILSGLHPALHRARGRA